MDDPTMYLVEPEEPEASITKGFANPLALLNYASPSAWINEAITELTGFDVMGWMGNAVAGDWAAIYKFGDAMENLAKFQSLLGVNVQMQVEIAERSWQGNAAAAADQYFASLGQAASVQQIPLRDVRDRYHKAAIGAWELSNQLGNILQALADKAVLAGISALAGSVLAETGVGAVVGYGVAAVTVADMLSDINKASTKIQSFGGVIIGMFGGGMDMGSMGDGGELNNYPLPAGAYDNLLVAS